MTADALTDLDRYKLPALQQGGYRLATQLRALLFSRAGYSDKLVNLAASDDRVTLVDVPFELARRPEST